MSRVFASPPAFVDPTTVTIDNFFNPLKDAVDLVGLGSFPRNVRMGGSMTIGIAAEVTGDVVLPDWALVILDNSNNQISGSANVIVRVRFLVRVSNGAINVTPKVYKFSAGADATITGALACAATSDAYMSSNQQQTVTLTLPNGVTSFQPRLTIGGTPAPGYKVWGTAILDCFING